MPGTFVAELNSPTFQSLLRPVSGCLRANSALPITTISPIATIKANLSNANQTDICPRDTAKAIKPEKAINIQNMIEFPFKAIAP